MQNMRSGSACRNCPSPHILHSMLTCFFCILALMLAWFCAEEFSCK